MNTFTRLRRSLPLLVALLGLGVAGPTTAHADPIPPQAAAAQAHPAAPAPPPAQGRAPAVAKQALTAAAQASGTPTYVGANGKVYVNATQASHLAAVEEVTGPGSGVLQIMQTAGTQHTKASFEGRLLHFQYANGSGNWRMRPWGDRLRPSDHKTFSAMIQLTPAEASNLRLRLEGIFAEEGPEWAAGPNWANGKIRNSVGVPSFNCASAWCSMPIGEHGESVASLIGIPANGDPFSLQRTLESGGNERIFGIAVFGPQVPGFGADKAAKVTATNMQR